MENRDNTMLAIWNTVAQFFKAPKDWSEIEDKPIYPLPAYLTLRNDAARPGYVMQDGTIFAGRSPHTGRPLYVTPADAPPQYAEGQ